MFRRRARRRLMRSRENGVITRSMSTALRTSSPAIAGVSTLNSTINGLNSNNTNNNNVIDGVRRNLPGLNQDGNSTIFAEIRKTENRFRSSCQQIVLLNQNLDDLQNRYLRAVQAEQRSFRYSLRLRMAVLEGIRNMYYEYACRKADELTNLRCQVFGSSEGGDEMLSDSESDAEDSDENNQ
ncbi:uncharacterized protein LOC141898434 [Tubulanus polymorphus]|uniref:uncharacterized protein LOC141898434 n=1 Tax=Tubulanus polymorphus TaxID=672921 RepID=UPI003DA50072